MSYYNHVLTFIPFMIFQTWKNEIMSVRLQSAAKKLSSREM
jgi:hypothetical protein